MTRSHIAAIFLILKNQERATSITFATIHREVLSPIARDIALFVLRAWPSNPVLAAFRRNHAWSRARDPYAMWTKLSEYDPWCN